MSVPKPNRESGELEVNTLALQLCLHTLKITDNEKIFTPNHKDVVTMARRMAIDIDRLCWRANNIKVGQSKKLCNDRLELERRAGELRNKIRAWYQSDEARLKP